MESEGLRRLRELCSHGRGRAVCRAAGLMQSTLRGILNGSKPNPGTRAALLKSHEIPAASWDVPPWEPDAPATNEKEKPDTPSELAMVDEAKGEPVHWDPVTGWESGAGIVNHREPDTTTLEAPEALDALGTVRQLLAGLHREAERLRIDPTATGRDRASVASSLASATRLLTRVDGSGEITHTQILRSPHWRRIMRIAVTALTPYPGAYDALAEALEASD